MEEIRLSDLLEAVDMGIYDVNITEHVFTAMTIPESIPCKELVSRLLGRLVQLNTPLALRFTEDFLSRKKMEFTVRQGVEIPPEGLKLPCLPYSREFEEAWRSACEASLPELRKCFDYQKQVWENAPEGTPLKMVAENGWRYTNFIMGQRWEHGLDSSPSPKAAVKKISWLKKLIGIEW